MIYQPGPHSGDNLALRRIFFDINFSIKLLLPNGRFVVTIHDIKYDFDIRMEGRTTAVGCSDSYLELGPLKFVSTRTKIWVIFLLHY